jgi:dienelactone hydrolase
VLPRAARFYRRSAILTIAATVLASLGAVFGQTFAFGPLERPKASGPCAVDVSDLLLPGGPDGRDIAVRMWAPTPDCLLANEHQAAGADSRMPLVLYFPGLGGGRGDGAVQASELASHGYAVAGVDDVSSPSLHGEKATVNFDLSSDASVARLFEQGNHHAQAQSDLLGAVLAGLRAKLSSTVAGHIDFERIGVLGYSMGGAAGALAARSDDRVRAYVNMDGWVYGEAARDMPQKPYLMLWSDESFPPARDLSSPDMSRRNEARINTDQNAHNFDLLARPQTFWVHLRGSVHGDFSDALYGPATFRNHRAISQRRDIGMAINGYVLAFFDLSLKGVASPLLTERKSLYASARMMTSADKADLSARAPTQPGAGAN